MRRYDVLYLDSDDCLGARQLIAPATPRFENGFSAFARGTLIRTVNGPCAIEDLEPGTDILTEEFGALPLRWRGSMTLIPNAPEIDPETQRLTRVLADTYGVGRPSADLMLGAAARLPRRGQRGVPQLIEAADLADGEMIFRTTPPSPVQIYHLCLPMQATINANGIGVASFHPGIDLAERMGPNMLKLFLSLFPHARSLSDFGAAIVQRTDPPAPEWEREREFGFA